MRRQRALVLAAVSMSFAAWAVGVAAGAPRDASALHHCGAVTTGGAVWQVSASSVISCSKARATVKELGAKPTPRVSLPYYSGLYLGMRCLGAKRNGHRLIDCGGAGGRAVAAVAGA
jgi:hypothetical protein